MPIPPKAVIFGCAGAALSDAERRFFAHADPLGFILFARNCEAPAQLRTLVGELRESVGRADAPVLIDQEGGRVAPSSTAILFSSSSRVIRKRSSVGRWMV